MVNQAESRLSKWNAFLGCAGEAVRHVTPILSSGHLTSINGLVMEAAGLKLPLGSSCRILPVGGTPIVAEVVGFNGERLFLMPSEDVYGLSPGARVVAIDPHVGAPKLGQPLLRAAARSIAPNCCRSARPCWAVLSTAPGVRSTGTARCTPKPCAPCRGVRSTRCPAHRLTIHSMSVCVPSTPC